MSDALCLTRVRIHDGTRMLVDTLDLTIVPGECATVMGPRGSGKSALLAWIAGTLDPGFRVRGRVSIGGDEIATLPIHRRRIGVQFADDLLFPQLTVAGNLMFALPPAIRGRVARRAMAEKMLRDARVGGGHEDLADRHPEGLSPLQRGKIALLRTLAAEPRALLLDDPFGKLDPQDRSELRRFAFDQAGMRELPMLLATRDAADARAAGGPVIVLPGDGDAPVSLPVSAAADAAAEPRPRVRRA